MLDANLLHQRLVRYGNTTIGRDKIYRFIQYFSRFLVHFWESTHAAYYKSKILKAKLLIKHLSLARKLLRIGRPIDYLSALNKILVDQTYNTWAKMLNLSKYTLLSIWMYFDFLLWLQGVGIVPPSPQTLKRAYQFWFLGLMCGFLSSVQACKETYTKMLSSKPGSPLFRTLKIHGIPMVFEMIDMLVPAKGLDWVPFSDGFIGLTGALSSFMGAKAQWKKISA